MNKGELTRQKIIEKAAVIFNSDGYEGASLSKLMKAAELKKGGIYNHFNSKEEILIEAFAYSIKQVQLKIQCAIDGKKTASEKLFAIINFYRDYPMNPVVKGGCPVLNSIVYTDNTNLAFRESVKKAVDALIKVLELIIKVGIKNGEFKDEFKPNEAAIIIFSAIEGGVAVSRTYEKSRYMNLIMDHLENYIRANMIK